MIKHLLIILFISLSGSLNRCSSPVEQVAGGTSIPNQITGNIRTSTGTPVINGKVKLIDLLSRDKLLPEVVDSTRTGTLGDYRFEDIEEGTYAIEATDASSLVMFRTDINVGYSDTIDVSGVLVNSGTITGSVAIPGNFDLILHIANSHHSAVPDSSGTFTITGLQPGTCTLLTIAHDAVTGNAAIIRCDTVLITGESPIAVGTLETQPLHRATGVLVVDDFEDGDNITDQGQYWWMFDDRYDGGGSHVVPFNSDSMVQQNETGADNFSAHCTFTFGGESGPRHIGMGFTFGSSYRDIPQTYDLSGLRKIHFRAMGNGCNLLADIRPELLDDIAGVNSQFHPVSADWTEFTVDVESLTAVDSVAAQNIIYSNRFIILATGDAEQRGELWIDDIRFEY